MIIVMGALMVVGCAIRGGYELTLDTYKILRQTPFDRIWPNENKSPASI